MLAGLLFVVGLFLLVYCAFNIVTTPAEQVRGLPRPLWLVVVLFVPVVGPVAWLLAGRPQGAAPGRSARGSRHIGTTRSSPDDDEDFLRGLRQRAAEQRRAAEEQRRREQGEAETGGA